MNQQIIHKLFEYLELGTLRGKPQQVFGGLLHKMYKVETSSGVYAVKALNPIIMKREMAISNTIFSEKVAKVAYRDNIPVVVAFEKDGCIHDIEGSHFMVFNWVDAKSVTQEETTIHQCKTIGKILSQIHCIDISELENNVNSTPGSFKVDWQQYCGLGTDISKEIGKYLHKIEKWTSLVNQSILKVCTNQVISHRDMDCKNVLWDKDGTPFVIDWESAGYVNPLVELIDVALAWSGMSTDNPNLDKFKAVVSSYIENGGTIYSDISAILNYGYMGRLEWLEYSIKRAVGEESSDEEERKLGVEQVYGTLIAIEDYEQMIPVIEDILKEYNKE